MPRVLTRQQRNLIYKELLKIVCKDPSTNQGMCFYLSRILMKSNKIPDWWRYLSGCAKMYDLPELNKMGICFPPYTYWAPLNKRGWEKRIKWIQKAIEETKNHNQNK